MLDWSFILLILVRNTVAFIHLFWQCNVSPYNFFALPLGIGRYLPIRSSRAKHFSYFYKETANKDTQSEYLHRRNSITQISNDYETQSRLVVAWVTFCFVWRLEEKLPSDPSVQAITQCVFFASQRAMFWWRGMTTGVFGFTTSMLVLKGRTKSRKCRREPKHRSVFSPQFFKSQTSVVVHLFEWIFP